jgi:hypothetical protein
MLYHQYKPALMCNVHSELSDIKELSRNFIRKADIRPLSKPKYQFVKTNSCYQTFLSAVINDLTNNEDPLCCSLLPALLQTPCTIFYVLCLTGYFISNIQSCQAEQQLLYCFQSVS